jgi:hypothetical protein
MSKSLKYTFGIHAIVSLIFGAALLLAPGRTLGLFGWSPVDPLMSRGLGAALLGLAWGSFRAWQATERKQVAILVEAEAVFCVLACVGLLRHVLAFAYPWYVWGITVIFAAFAIAWILALVRRQA